MRIPDDNQEIKPQEPHFRVNPELTSTPDE
jgi:hypothetical protein